MDGLENRGRKRPRPGRDRRGDGAGPAGGDSEDETPAATGPPRRPAKQARSDGPAAEAPTKSRKRKRREKGKDKDKDASSDAEPASKRRRKLFHWRQVPEAGELALDSRGLTVTHMSRRPADGLVFADENAGSIPLLIEFGDFRYYTAGDLPAAQELDLLRSHGGLRLSALKCGHHGSANSTPDTLLQAWQPTLALMSCGQQSFGHPTFDVVERLIAAESVKAVYATSCIHNRGLLNPRYLNDEAAIAGQIDGEIQALLQAHAIPEDARFSIAATDGDNPYRGQDTLQAHLDDIDQALKIAVQGMRGGDAEALPPVSRHVQARPNGIGDSDLRALKAVRAWLRAAMRSEQHHRFVIAHAGAIKAMGDSQVFGSNTHLGTICLLVNATHSEFVHVLGFDGNDAEVKQRHYTGEGEAAALAPADAAHLDRRADKVLRVLRDNLIVASGDGVGFAEVPGSPGRYVDGVDERVSGRAFFSLPTVAGLRVGGSAFAAPACFVCGREAFDDQRDTQLVELVCPQSHEGEDEEDVFVHPACWPEFLLFMTNREIRPAIRRVIDEHERRRRYDDGEYREDSYVSDEDASQVDDGTVQALHDRADAYLRLELARLNRTQADGAAADVEVLEEEAESEEEAAVEAVEAVEEDEEDTVIDRREIPRGLCSGCIQTVGDLAELQVVLTMPDEGMLASADTVEAVPAELSDQGSSTDGPAMPAARGNDQDKGEADAGGGSSVRAEKAPVAMAMSNPRTRQGPGQVKQKAPEGDGGKTKDGSLDSLAESELLILMLDVDQGECQVIIERTVPERDDGASEVLSCLVIDGGHAIHGAGYIARVLDAFGVEKVNHVVFTHYDRDHAKGLVGWLNYDPFAWTVHSILTRDDPDDPGETVKSELRIAHERLTGATSEAAGADAEEAAGSGAEVEGVPVMDRDGNVEMTESGP